MWSLYAQTTTAWSSFLLSTNSTLSSNSGLLTASLVLSRAHTIVYTLTIRDAQTGEIVISTPIGYDQIELEELEQQLFQYHSVTQRRTGNIPPLCQRRYFTKYYNSTTTIGMDLAAVGRAMREAGFSPETHRIFSWYTRLDVYVLYIVQKQSTRFRKASPFFDSESMIDCMIGQQDLVVDLIDAAQ
jgi:hypothetical protein